MTSKERLLCVLSGGTPDRVPVSPFVQENYLSFCYNNPKPDRLTDALRLSKELDFDLMSRMNFACVPYFMKHSSLNWEVEHKEFVEEDNLIYLTTITTPKGKLVQKEGTSYNSKQITGFHMATMEYLIKDQDAFEIFKEYFPRREKKDINNYLEIGRESKKIIGQDGITVPWCLGGLYNFVSTYMDVQNMLIDPLINLDYYNEYMNFFLKIVEEDMAIFAKSDFDAIGIQGNIANGALMDSKYFDKYILPYEEKIIKIACDANKPTIYHNCGNAKNLYPSYKKMNFTAWETLSPTPQGDNVLSECKKYFGDDLVLIGNLDQINFLKTASLAEIEKAAYEKVVEGKDGAHYVFACSDYLETPTPIENVKAMIKGAKAAARY